MHPAAREIPDQPGIDRSKGELARFRAGARAFHLSKNGDQVWLAWQRAEAPASEKSYEQKMKDSGVTFTSPDPAPLRTAVEPFYKEYGDKINALTVSLDLPFAMNRFCGA